MHQTLVGLTAFGAAQAGISLSAQRYQQAFAQPTRRKLALLIGINRYSEQVCDRPVSGNGNALRGCLTDVDLQRELLIHRFGFQSSDIVSLTDEQATRDGIESTFQAHLTNQVRSGDVVVVHLSGFGSRVQLPDELGGVQQSFVPYDGRLPDQDEPFVNDVLLQTLALLLRSLKTDRITTILDLSYVDTAPMVQGGLRVRSRPSVPSGDINPDELDCQRSLMSQQNISRQQLLSQIKSEQWPGTLLTAAQGNQIAVEGQWTGFSAGLFTYSLTQHIWTSTAATSLRMSLGQASSAVEKVIGERQQPLLLGHNSESPTLQPFYQSPIWEQGVDGVVTAVGDDRKSLSIWLAGLPVSVLNNYNMSALLWVETQSSEAIAAPIAKVASDNNQATPTPQDTPLSEPNVDPSPESAPTSPSSETTPQSNETPNDAQATQARNLAANPIVVQARSRQGLTVRARLQNNATLPSEGISVGTPVREKVRILPRNLGLTVALDNSLERIERVDATSAFAASPGVASVVTGEQPADCLFGKVQISKSLPDDASHTVAASLPSLIGDLSPSKSAYGLFYLGRAAVPNTVIDEEEAVKTAVNRLSPRLKLLLSTKLLRLTENVGSSRLGVRATLDMISPQERIVLQQETSRAPWPRPESRLAALFTGRGELPTLPFGSQIQYRLQNYSDRPIYFAVLGLDNNGNSITLYPKPIASDEEMDTNIAQSSVIAPGDILTIPKPRAASEWVLRGNPGYVETHLIFSQSPLTRTYQLLKTSMRSPSNAQRIGNLSRPLEAVQAMLSDLHNASTQLMEPAQIPADTYALHVDAWATLSFVYRVDDIDAG